MQVIKGNNQASRGVDSLGRGAGVEPPGSWGFETMIECNRVSQALGQLDVAMATLGGAVRVRSSTSEKK